VLRKGCFADPVQRCEPPYGDPLWTAHRARREGCVDANATEQDRSRSFARDETTVELRRQRRASGLDAERAAEAGVERPHHFEAGGPGIAARCQGYAEVVRTVVPPRQAVERSGQPAAGPERRPFTIFRSGSVGRSSVSRRSD